MLKIEFKIMHFFLHQVYSNKRGRHFHIDYKRKCTLSEKIHWNCMTSFFHFLKQNIKSADWLAWLISSLFINPLKVFFLFSKCSICIRILYNIYHTHRWIYSILCEFMNFCFLVAVFCFFFSSSIIKLVVVMNVIV